MYQAFFGFNEPPFHITPDPKFLFLTAKHREALASLIFGVQNRQGFIVLIGEVGCGKTTVCRQFLSVLDPQLYDTALILNPTLEGKELPRLILNELGIDNPSSPLNPTRQLQDELLRRIALKKNIVLIIDEAQTLSIETLESLRLLSNLETDNQKLIQVILIGQPELKAKLKKKALRQLRQRILVYVELPPLSKAETLRYIHHRLTLAGSHARAHFTSWAIRKIFKKSRGTPRLINQLCDKALLAAYVRNSDEVRVRDVARAVAETMR